MSGRMRMQYLLGCCSPPEAQIKCIAVLCAMSHEAFVSQECDTISLPPSHPDTFPGTSVPQSPPPHDTHMIGDLQDKPGLPQSLSVPTPRLPHPILTCSGLQLLADIWKENEVIYIIKTNCLTSVKLHCCAIMEWFRCFVRHRAGGKLLSHPGNVIAAPQSSFWRDLGWLEQDMAVVSGRKHKTKIEDS